MSELTRADVAALVTKARMGLSPGGAFAWNRPEHATLSRALTHIAEADAAARAVVDDEMWHPAKGKSFCCNCDAPVGSEPDSGCPICALRATLLEGDEG